MIEIKNLTKFYGRNAAVKNLSFTVNDNEILGFLGPNGAGKSTTMNIITGFLPSTSGTVTINGLDISENPSEAKKMIGYLPEIPPVYLDMKVKEYLDKEHIESFIPMRYVEKECQGKKTRQLVPAIHNLKVCIQ